MAAEILLIEFVLSLLSEKHVQMYDWWLTPTCTAYKTQPDITTDLHSTYTAVEITLVHL